MKRIELIKKSDSPLMNNVTWSPSGNSFVSAGLDSYVYLWDLENLTYKRLIGHTEQVTEVAFHPKKNRFVSVSFDKKIIIWDGDTGSKLLSLKGHDRKISSVKYSKSGKYIYTACYGSLIKVWDSETMELINVLEGNCGQIRCIDAHPTDENILVSGSFDGEVTIWSIDSNTKISSGVQSISIIDAKFSKDGYFFSVCGQGKLISIYEFPSCKTVTGLISKNSYIENIEFLDDSNFIASSSSLNNGVQIWDIYNQKSICDYELSTSIEQEATVFSTNVISVLKGDKMVRISESEGVEIFKINNSNFEKIFGENSPKIKDPEDIRIYTTSREEERALLIQNAVRSYELGRNTEALEILSNISELYYNYAYYELKGNILKAEKNFQSAIDAYKKSLYFENSVISYAGIGEILTAQKEYRLAIYAYSEAIDIFNNTLLKVGNKRILAQFYYNRALNNYNLKQEHTFYIAIQEGKESLKIDDSYHRAYYVIAVANFQLYFISSSNQFVEEGARFLNIGVELGDNNCRIIATRIQNQGFSRSILY